MHGPQFTLRQLTAAIAVIGVLLGILVRNPDSPVLVAIVSIPVAMGFMIGVAVRRGVEKLCGCSMTKPRIRSALILAAVGVAVLVVTILNSGHSELHGLELALVYSLPFLLGFVIYQVSQGSLRFRLTAEILTLVALLALTGWTWRPQRLMWAAERSDELAMKVSAWAERTSSSKKRDALRRESEWFHRRAFSLRCEAFWYGLTHGAHGDPEHEYVYNTEDLVRELGILEAMEAHQMRERQEMEGQDSQKRP